MSVCYEFQDTGSCKYGDNCRFPHGNQSAGVTSACRQWRDTGSCSYGSSCRFSHDGGAPSFSGNKGGPPMAGVDGNWMCAKCDNVNYAHREKCNRCEESRPAGQRGGGQNWGQQPYGGAPYGGGAAPGWGAPNNPPFGFPQPARFPPHLEQMARNFLAAFASEPDPVDTAIKCILSVDAGPPIGGFGQMPFGMQAGNKRRRTEGFGNGFGGNFGGGERRNQAPVAGVDGNWKCPDAECGNVNFPRRTHCNRCQRERPADKS